MTTMDGGGTAPHGLCGWVRRLATGVRTGFRVLLHEIRTRVPGVHREVALFLGLGFLVVLAGTWGFVEVAESVLEGSTHRFDEAVLRWIGSRATPFWDDVALEVTALGDGLVVAMLIFISSVILWVTGHRYSVLLLWVAFLGALVLVEVLKTTFARPRPTVFEYRGGYSVGSPSFPSGHALGSTVAYMTLAYLIARLQATAFLRRLTTTIGVLAVLAIGVSRMYLGVHYPSDVLAGFAIGIAWATLCALGIEALRYFREGETWIGREADARRRNERKDDGASP